MIRVGSSRVRAFGPSRSLKNWVARADFLPVASFRSTEWVLPRFFVPSDACDRRFRTLRRHYGSDLLRQNGSSHQVSHAHQIVGCASERENPIHFQCAAVPQSAQQRDGLQPAEAFFDALPLLLAEGIARLSRGAAVDGTAASSSGVLRSIPDDSPSADSRSNSTWPPCPCLCAPAVPPDRFFDSWVWFERFSQ